MQTSRVPHAEALSGVAGEAHHQRRLLHSVVAPASGDLPGYARPDRAVEVAELVGPLPARLRLDRRQHLTHHALGELALVEGRIRLRAAVLRCIALESRRREDGSQVQLAL